MESKTGIVPKCSTQVRKDRGYHTPLFPRYTYEPCGRESTVTLYANNGNLLAWSCKRHGAWIEELRNS